MALNTLSLAHGYVEQPKAGRKIFIATMLLNLAALSIAIIAAIKGGPDYTHEMSHGIFENGNIIKSSWRFLLLGSFILIIIHSSITKGWKATLLTLAALFGVGFFYEGLGVNYGWVYGPYHYTELSPFHFWGVPVLVPVAWELFLYPVMHIVKILLPAELYEKNQTGLGKVKSMFLFAFVAGLIVTMIDLALDPIFVNLNVYVWHIPGDFVYYEMGGVPFLNFFGWFFTGFTGAILYQLIMERVPEKKHVRSAVLDLYCPLAFWGGLFAWALTIQLFYFHQGDVILTLLLSAGTIISLSIGKIHLLKNGFGENIYLAQESDNTYKRLSASKA